MEALDRAIELDGRLGPAFHNRALTAFRWASPAKRPPNAQARTDIDEAIEIGPPSAQLYFDAARIYAQLEQRKTAVVDYLEEALRRGAAPQTVRREFSWAPDHPHLKGLLARPGHGAYRQRDEAFVDPLPGDSFWPR